jgi:dolichol-phosphate mannosyltransferase
MKYSVVIPLKDEVENIEPLVREVVVAMEPLEAAWELLCIDDGSTDGSWQLLEKLAQQDNRIKPLAMARNYGQSSALDAGFRRARGETIITLDGDGQNDPSDIPRLLQHLEMADLVCGWRVDRRDPLSKRLISRLSNAVRRRLCQDGVHDTGCSLKVYRATCLRQIRMYHGAHRFLPALFLLEGFRVAEVPVKHRERLRGKSKYNLFNRAIRPLVDTLGVWWMARRRLNYQLRHE